MSDPERASACASGGEQRAGAYLIGVLDTAARELLSSIGDAEHVLELIVAGAIALVPHVQRAGISLIERDGTVTPHASSDDIVAEVEQLQSELGEGPCHESVREQRRVLVADLASSERWPRFAPAAVQRGVATVCSFPLFALNGSTGALSIYAATPAAFDENSLDTTALFASYAAIALHGGQRVDQLNAALRSRDVIGQAKGILIERFAVSEEQAFAMLVRSSQDTNLKLRDVADWLVGDTIHGRRDPSPR